MKYFRQLWEIVRMILLETYVRILQYFRADFKRLVRIVYIETTTECNLRCSYCPNSKYERSLKRNRELMDVALFHKIIDHLKEIKWSGEIEPHSYGEPLLDPRLDDLISYARRQLPQSDINLHSNGELLTLERYLLLVESGVNKFTVTQHLPTIPKGIQDILDYRTTNGNMNVDFSYQKLDQVWNRGGLIDVKRRIKIKKCYMPIRTIGFDYVGNVLVCCHDYLHQVNVGNINKETLYEIWNKPEYRDIRKDSINGNLKLNICKKCYIGTMGEE